MQTRKRRKIMIVVMSFIMIFTGIINSKDVNAYLGGWRHKHTPENVLYWNQNDYSLQKIKLPSNKYGRNGGSWIYQTACSWYSNFFMAYKGGVLKEGYDPVQGVKDVNKRDDYAQMVMTDWGHLNFSYATPILHPGMKFVRTETIQNYTNDKEVYNQILKRYKEGYGVVILWRNASGGGAHYVTVDYLTTDGKVRILDSAYIESYLHEANDGNGNKFYAREMWLYSLDSGEKFMDFDPVYEDYDPDTLIGGGKNRNFSPGDSNLNSNNGNSGGRRRSLPKWDGKTIPGIGLLGIEDIDNSGVKEKLNMELSDSEKESIGHWIENIETEEEKNTFERVRFIYTSFVLLLGLHWILLILGYVFSITLNNHVLLNIASFGKWEYVIDSQDVVGKTHINGIKKIDFLIRILLYLFLLIALASGGFITYLKIIISRFTPNY